MAGLKGRSGGARQNSGGARAGAGRPRKEVKASGPPVAPPPLDLADVQALIDDPRYLIARIALDQGTEQNLRLQAATTLLVDQTKRLLGRGKKAAKEDAAQAATSKFSRRMPPPTHLRVASNNT
jgi:phage terminase small subunit